MLDRLQWRVQPIEHIRKRKQRHKEMLQREKQFAEFLAKEQAKKLPKQDKDAVQDLMAFKRRYKHGR